jgi:hypothetical protein
MRVIPFVGVILICATSPVRGDQDALTAAKDLYASAAYEEALAALAGIDEASPEIARAVDQYRVSCLYALGRKAEAEEVAELLIQREPLVQLDDAAPRIEAMFQDVRKRLLPRVIRAEYKIAKAAITEKDPARAKPHLVAARNMIDEAEKIGVRDDGLTDLQVLVDGFLDLVDTAVAEQIQPAPSTTVTGASSQSAQGERELATQSRAVTAVYGPEDQGVVPPSIVHQGVPQIPSDLVRFVAAPGRGVLEVVIDESGAVQATTMRRSLHPIYDAMVVTASRAWRYTPATKDGVPVKFRRTIVINLR